MRALVFGGSGHIGSAVVRQLAAEGWQVTIVSRQPRLPLSLASVAATIIVADDRRPQTIAHLKEDYALVVDAAAPYPLTMLGDTGRLLNDTRARTRAFIRLARRCGATLSYIGSYVTEQRARSAAGWLQSNAFRRLHPYFTVKQLIVDELLAARNVAVTIINPTVCMGPWDRKPLAQCIVAQLARGNVPAVAKRTINIVDVRDVALAVVAAYRVKRCGRPITICGHNVPLIAFAQQVAALAGVKPPHLEVSSIASAWLSTATQLGCELANIPSPLPALAMVLLTESGPMLLGGAQRGLNVMPRPLGVTLADAYDWYRHIGYC